MQDVHDRFALLNGYRLNEFRIRQVLGHGGFGITYLARDERLDRDVAIKEFMPGDLAVRETGSTVIPRSTSVHQDYKGGLERFLKEARTLAQFSHPNIVQVLTLFEANGTAYIVMCYEEGESLASHLKARANPIPAPELLAIAEPLLDGLAAVHRTGFLHRDIKPANIFIRTNGTPVLLDFGTARQVIGGMSRSIISILTPGYAPIEQYHAQGDQGPWTDVYGMGAVLYSCISGRVPPEAPARVQAEMDGQPDPLQAATSVGHGRYPDSFLLAIDKSLALRPKDRLRSALELRQTLVPAAPQQRNERRFAPSRMPRMLRPAAIVTAGAALAAAAVSVVLLRSPITVEAPRAMSGLALAPERSSPAAGLPSPAAPSAPPAPSPPPEGASSSPVPRSLSPAAPSMPPATHSGGATTAAIEAVLITAREAIQVSTAYGRESFRRLRQQEALPSLERLSKVNTRYQSQLDNVVQGIGNLGHQTASLLQQYSDLVDKLASRPDEFERIKPELFALELSDVGKLAREHLIAHVAARARGPINPADLQASLDRSYASRDLW